MDSPIAQPALKIGVLSLRKTERQPHELDAVSAAEVAAGFSECANLLLLKTIQQIAFLSAVCFAHRANKQSHPIHSTP